MIPSTPGQRIDAIEALQNHHFHMRIAANILKTNGPIDSTYHQAMKEIHRTGKILDKFGVDAKTKPADKKAETKDPEKLDDKE